MISMMRGLGFFACLLMFVSLAGCECAGNMRKFDVTVQLDDALQSRAVKLDLVGVADPGSWTTERMTDYWSQGPEHLRGRADRAGLLKKLTFEPGRSSNGPVTIPKTDAIWKTWDNMGATKLFVLAYISGQDHENKDGEADAWRAILKLDECWWDRKAKKLNVNLNIDGVNVSPRELTVRREK